MVKKIGIALLAVVIIIQFIPVSRENPALGQLVPSTPEVLTILKRSCFDCHSNETVWPWYSHVAPMKFLVAHDVEEGREHLNLSEWNQIEGYDSMDLAEELQEVMEEKAMPLKPYLLMHPEARMSDKDREVLMAWAKTLTKP